MKQAVAFYSEGCKLSGDLYLPRDLGASDRRETQSEKQPEKNDSHPGLIGKAGESLD